MSKISCPQCRSGVRGGAVYCDRCGLKIPTALKFEPSRVGGSKAPQWIGGIVVGLMLIGITIAIVMVVLQPAKVLPRAEVKRIAKIETAQDAKARREAEAEQWLLDKRRKDAEDKQRTELARGLLLVQKLHAVAKVPESVKIVSATVGAGGAVCIEYRANNSFNAALRGFALIDPYDDIYFDNINKKTFEKKYYDYCSYTSKDITSEVNYYYPLL